MGGTPQSISFRETNRMVVWKTTWAIFWKNCTKYGKSTKKCPSNKGARFARPFCGHFFVLFPYFLQFFQKNGPGSFAQAELLLIRYIIVWRCSLFCFGVF